MFCSLLVFCLIVADSSSHSDQCIIVGIIWFIRPITATTTEQSEWQQRQVVIVCLSCLTCEVSVVWRLPHETDWIR